MAHRAPLQRIWAAAAAAAWAGCLLGQLVDAIPASEPAGHPLHDASPTHDHAHRLSHGGAGSTPQSQHMFWLIIAAIVVLVLLGGLFAGLTLGLLSLDLMSLEILERSGDEVEKKYARKIKPLRKQGHWLLVTLLLSNVVVNETLPILTDSVFSGGWPAIVISSTLIVIFGEIIPQAVCSRYGLAIGAKCAWFVRLLMVLLYPIAYPVSRLLDKVLGETEGMTYKRAELKALVQLHERSEQHFGPLSTDEVTVIKAVLDLRDKTVVSVMTPLDSVYMVSWDQVLDTIHLHELMEKGHSRVPVYAGSRRNIVGMLLVKKLVTYNPAERLRVKDFPNAIMSVPVIAPNTPCFDILNLFQEGRSHMAIIVDDVEEKVQAATNMLGSPYSRPELNVLGIITLEDVIEELIGEEIVDETDVYVDMTTRKDLVRRFKSPRYGPSTPRLGPWSDDPRNAGAKNQVALLRSQSSLSMNVRASAPMEEDTLGAGSNTSYRSPDSLHPNDLPLPSVRRALSHSVVPGISEAQSWSDDTHSSDEENEVRRPLNPGT